MANNEIQSFDMSDLAASLPSAAALSSEDRAGIVDVLKRRLQSLAGQHSAVLESLSPLVRKRIEILREIQVEHGDLEAKFFEERAALEAKYQKLYQPLYTKRYEIVNGILEVDGNENEDAMDQGDHSSEKGVPDFWLNAMKANVVLAEEITERDEGALKYLKDVKWCRIDSPKGFKLEFLFDTNPYFKNTLLTKTYHVVEEDEPVLEKAIGTEIEWYPSKNLTQKIFKKKSRKDGPTKGKLITKTEDCPSFFNFFNPPQMPEDEDDDIYDDEELHAEMELDFDIGSIFRDEIIPHAVSWFTGEAVPEDEFQKKEGNGEEDADEEDEDESDDEDEEENATNKKNGRAVAGEGQQGERPPECKQQ